MNGLSFSRLFVPLARRDGPLLKGAGRQRRWALLWYCIVALYCASWVPAIGDGYFSGLVFQNDARQQITPYWWFHSDRDTEDSVIYDYMYRYTTLGHRALYFFLTWMLTPPVASQLVGLVLLAVLIFYCYRFGAKTTHALGAVLAILLLRRYGWTMVGGLPRSFGPPVILAFTYYFLAHGERGILATLVAAALFYPPALLICTVTYVLYLAGTVIFVRRERMPTLLSVFRLGVVCCICLLLLLPNLHKPERIGKVVSLEQAQSMPEWHRGGRFPWLPLPRMHRAIIEQPGHSFDTFVNYQAVELPEVKELHQRWISVLLLAAAVILLVAGPARATALPLLCHGAASVILYCVASALAFRLFLPQRMFAYGLRLTTIVATCFGFASIGRVKCGRLQIPLREVMLTAMLVLVFFVWQPGIPGSKRRVQAQRDFGLVDVRAMRSFYDRFRALPEDTLVAGDPHALDNVIMTSGLDVYFTLETAHPLYDNYYTEISRRIRALHNAYFATNLQDVASFLNDENIDVLVVNRRQFGRTAGIRYRLFEPHTTEVRRRYAEVEAGDFVLAQTNAPGVIFSEGPYSAIDASRLVEAAEASSGE